MTDNLRESSDTKRLLMIQDEVGMWSWRNFGRQESRSVPSLVLGSLAPLIGIVEEVGELEEAEKDADVRDAVGDIGIYICDYSYREELELHVGIVDSADAGSTKNIALISAKQLMHATLKHHQGIRGFEDEGVYRSVIIRSLHRMIAWLDFRCQKLFQDSFVDVVDETWQRVKKRNWKKNRKQG